ncbi:MAG: hypothetical protein C5B49_00075, partial [Bdellovibrio sp.]
ANTEQILSKKTPTEGEEILSKYLAESPEILSKEVPQHEGEILSKYLAENCDLALNSVVKYLANTEQNFLPSAEEAGSKAKENAELKREIISNDGQRHKPEILSKYLAGDQPHPKHPESIPESKKESQPKGQPRQGEESSQRFGPHLDACQQQSQQDPWQPSAERQCAERRSAEVNHPSGPSPVAANASFPAPSFAASPAPGNPAQDLESEATRPATEGASKRGQAFTPPAKVSRQDRVKESEGDSESEKEEKNINATIKGPSDASLMALQYSSASDVPGEAAATATAAAAERTKSLDPDASKENEAKSASQKKRKPGSKEQPVKSAIGAEIPGAKQELPVAASPLPALAASPPPLSEYLANTEQTLSKYLAEYLANTEQTLSKYLANTEQIPSKHLANTEQTLSKYLAEYLANTEQELRIDTLAGNERVFLDFVYEQCKETASLQTKKLSSNEVAAALGLVTKDKYRAYQHVWNVIHRTTQKGFVRRSDARAGRNGWTVYELPNEVYRQLLAAEKLSPKYLAKHLANASIIINKNKSNINNNTAQKSPNDAADANTAPSSPKVDASQTPTDPQIGVDLSPVAAFGITGKHLYDIAKNKWDIDKNTLQELINRFPILVQSPDMKATKKELLPRIFMSIVKDKAKGGECVLDFVETEEDRLIQLQIAKMETLKREKEAREKALMESAFEEWRDEQGQQVLDSMFPLSTTIARNSEPYRLFLVEKFKESVWPNYRDGYLARIKS